MDSIKKYGISQCAGRPKSRGARGIKGLVRSLMLFSAMISILSTQFACTSHHVPTVRVTKQHDPPEGRGTHHLVEGQVTDHLGKPVTSAIVQIREVRKPGQNAIDAHDVRTDVDGRFSFDKIKWPYRLGVVWQKSVPSDSGFRHQYVGLDRVLKGSQTVSFCLAEFPTGTGVISGTVADQHAAPVKQFTLDVRKQDRFGELICAYGFRLFIVSTDGVFKFDNLPTGRLRVTAHLSGANAEEYTSGFAEVVLQEGVMKQIKLIAKKKIHFYGRILFRDKTPAFLVPKPWPRGQVAVDVYDKEFQVSHSFSNTDSDGYFVLRLSEEHFRGLKDGKLQLKVACPVPDAVGRHSLTGVFPSDKLSTDRSMAGSITVDRAKPYVRELSHLMARKISSLELPGVDGREYRLSDYRGQPVLINVFATRCGPCRTELPYLVKLHGKFAGRGLIFLSISKQEEMEAVRSFAQGKGIPWPVLIDQSAKEVKQFADANGKISIPRSVLLDRNHVVVYASVGFSEKGFKPLEAAVKKVVAKSKK